MNFCGLTIFLACQSAAIINQFYKNGQLVERWYKENLELYANHNDLFDFIAQIPRKESLLEPSHVRLSHV